MEPALIAVDIDGVLNPYNMSRSRGQKLGPRPSKRLRQERMTRTFWNRTHGEGLGEPQLAAAERFLGLL